MSAKETMLLVITVDIDPELDTAFNEWYTNVHVPEILACPGFLTARRLQAPDFSQRPRYVTCYEVDHLKVLESPEVDAVRGWGPFADDVTNYHRYWFRAVTPLVEREVVLKETERAN